jgi:predicted RND superfamily exporter protein
LGKSCIKSLLGLYLDKVARGEVAYLDRLASQLAERLVYIPVVTRTDSKNGHAGSIKVKALCLNEDQRSLIPIFTQERMLHAWCTERGASVKSITLLCADFCGALVNDSWIWVNPGTESAVALDPSMVEKIRQTSSALSLPPQSDTSPLTGDTAFDEEILDESEMDAGAVTPSEMNDFDPSSIEKPDKKRRSLLSFLGLKS